MTNTMTTWIWVAGAIQVGIIAANITLPTRLGVTNALSPVPTFIRQIFYVHWGYIVGILVLFSALCFGFARDLAGGSPIGCFLSAAMALFWAVRVVLQLLYYDHGVRSANRLLDALYVTSLVVLVAIFGAAALHAA